ncbi:MAG: HupE/UreJ family protein [Bacteroidota bacterium]
MSEFTAYLKLGIDHISDLQAYDHILFIIALTALYRIKDIKKVGILVTAFTIGHSVTLALATLNVILIPSEIIEFLIPVTILLTCIYNVTVTRKAYQTTENKKNYQFSYLIALLFGLIHGMGFSNYLRMLLGKEESILLPLLSFNLGLEIGQLFIVAIILSLMVLFQRGFGVSARSWTIFMSGAAAGISVILMSETAFWT